MTARKAPRTAIWPRPDELIPLQTLTRLLNDFLPPPALIEWNMDGGGSVLTTGLSGSLNFPNFTGYIEGWTLTSDQAAGSIVVDIWKRPYASAGVPTVADTITAAAKPTLAAAQKNTSTSVPTWTTTISPGDIISFNIDSVSLVTKANLALRIYR